MPQALWSSSVVKLCGQALWSSSVVKQALYLHQMTRSFITHNNGRIGSWLACSGITVAEEMTGCYPTVYYDTTKVESACSGL